MRICLVSRELAPFFGGGIGTYVSHASRALAEAGHDAHVLTDRHRALAGVTHLPWGAQVHTVELERAESGMDAYPSQAMRYSMGVHRALEALHSLYRFDLIEFPEWSGEGYFSLIAHRYSDAFSGAVLTVHLHTPTLECREMNRQDWLDRAAASVEHMEDECIRLADLVISPCKTLLDRVQSRLGALSRTQVIPHPLYVDSAAGPERELRRPGKRLLYFGRIERRKGVHLLIEAVQMLLAEGVDLVLDLVGSDTRTGPGGRWFREYLAENIDERWQSQIRFHSSKSFDELKDFVVQASACCFPTLAEWENFPNTCLEAMALGSVVVASDSLAEIIENRKTGLLFRNNDVGSFAAVIKEALGDSPRLQDMRLAAEAHVRSLCDPALFARRFEQCGVAVTDLIAKSGEGKKPPEVADVTIIVLHRGDQEDLRATLGSVRAQSLRGAELRVVRPTQGGSEGESMKVEFPGVEIENCGRRSITALRNVGLRLGTKPWVLFVDAGDRLEPTFLARVQAALEREPGAAWGTSLVSFFRKEPADTNMGWCPWGNGLGWLAGFDPRVAGGVLVKRKEALAAGGFDDWVAEFSESHLYCSLSDSGLRGVVVPEFLFYRRVLGGGAPELTTDYLKDWGATIAKHPALASADRLVLPVVLSDLNRALMETRDLRRSLWTRVYGRLVRLRRLFN